MSVQSILPHAHELIKGRLYWFPTNAPPANIPSNITLFTTDNELVYEPFYKDFGPLDIGLTTKYCRKLRSLLSDPSKADQSFVHFCSTNESKRSNAACLALSYLVIVEGVSAAEAWSRLANISPSFIGYCDASMRPGSFRLTIFDCLQGLEKGLQLGWYNLDSFDLASFDRYKKVENGDMTWIIPGKFLAFAGPNDKPIDEDGFPSCVPENYISVFKSEGISTIVRLNKKQYDSGRFTCHGFRHFDLYFLDGSCPPRGLADKFLKLAQEEAAIAVHCKAGLGRTGTLIGLYAMMEHGFPARAFIGWNRLCRPGSILGPQQQYLVEMEPAMQQLALRQRLARQVSGPTLTGDALHGDEGQGERLIRAKKEKGAGSNGRSAYLGLPTQTISSTSVSTAESAIPSAAPSNPDIIPNSAYMLNEEGDII